MSDLSQRLLETGHKGVHEQFDCVYAAALAYSSLHSGHDFLGASLRTHHKKIIKNSIKESMAKIGFNPGFLRSGLGFYAYEFWELIIRERLGPEPSPGALSEFTQAFLAEMGRYLDEQYQSDHLADSIGYLKQILQSS